MTERELSAEDGRGHYDFAAYNARGELQGATWTSAPVTFIVERDAYQARLNRHELAYVTVTRRPDHERLGGGFWKMYSQVRREGKSKLTAENLQRRIAGDTT